MRKSLALRMVALVAVLTAQMAAASNYDPCLTGDRFETVTMPHSWFKVQNGETKSLVVPGGWRYVKKIFIQARGAYSQSATFEVVANGDVKGTVYVPGSDPQYIVTVNETVRTLEFRGISGGTSEIFDVKAVQSVRNANDLECNRPPSFGFPSSLPSSNIATYLARRAIRNVDMLRPYADPATEYVEYLLPVKTVGGRAHAVASAEGDLSSGTRKAMIALSRQIVYAEPVINGLMKRDATFDLAVELLSIKQEIDARLH